MSAKKDFLGGYDPYDNNNKFMSKWFKAATRLDPRKPEDAEKFREMVGSPMHAQVIQPLVSPQSGRLHYGNYNGIPSEWFYDFAKKNKAQFEAHVRSIGYEIDLADTPGIGKNQEFADTPTFLEMIIPPELNPGVDFRKNYTKFKPGKGDATSSKVHKQPATRDPPAAAVASSSGANDLPGAVQGQWPGVDYAAKAAQTLRLREVALAALHKDNPGFRLSSAEIYESEAVAQAYGLSNERYTRKSGVASDPGAGYGAGDSDTSDYGDISNQENDTPDDNDDDDDDDDDDNRSHVSYKTHNSEHSNASEHTHTTIKSEHTHTTIKSEHTHTTIKSEHTDTSGNDINVSDDEENATDEDSDDDSYVPHDYDDTSSDDGNDSSAPDDEVNATDDDSDDDNYVPPDHDDASSDHGNDSDASSSSLESVNWDEVSDVVNTAVSVLDAVNTAFSVFDVPPTAVRARWPQDHWPRVRWPRVPEGPISSRCSVRSTSPPFIAQPESTEDDGQPGPSRRPGGANNDDDDGQPGPSRRNDAAGVSVLDWLATSKRIILEPVSQKAKTLKRALGDYQSELPSFIDHRQRKNKARPPKDIKVYVRSKNEYAEFCKERGYLLRPSDCQPLIAVRETAGGTVGEKRGVDNTFATRSAQGPGPGPGFLQGKGKGHKTQHDNGRREAEAEAAILPSIEQPDFNAPPPNPHQSDESSPPSGRSVSSSALRAEPLPSAVAVADAAPAYPGQFRGITMADLYSMGRQPMTISNKPRKPSEGLFGHPSNANGFIRHPAMPVHNAAAHPGPANAAEPALSDAHLLRLKRLSRLVDVLATSPPAGREAGEGPAAAAAAGASRAALRRTDAQERLRTETHRELAIARLHGVSVGQYRYYQGDMTVEEYLERGFCVCWDACGCSKFCSRFGDLICPCGKVLELLDD